MAKKKYAEEPVYPTASLVIAKGKFLELLGTQIEKGKELLTIDVPLANPQNAYFNYVRRYSDRVEYDENAQNDFFAKFNRWHERNKEIYRSSFAVANNIYFHEYESQIWSHLVIDDIIKIYKEDIARLINQMQTDIERSDLFRCEAPKPVRTLSEAKTTGDAKKNKVFIVHGHDSNTRNEAELLVKQLGFDPVVLFKMPNMGDTIIEKLLRESSEAAFAIVLYTKCDEGKAVEETDLKPRARQNVVFEHGLMCGMLGRKNVVALVEEGVEVPGDLSGVVYITLDNAQRWHFDVAREMKASGLVVDLNKLI